MKASTIPCGLLIASTSVLFSCSDSGSDPGSETVSNSFIQPIVIADPASEFSEPGSYTCIDCPDSDVSEFLINTAETSALISGTVSNAIGNGTYTIFADDGSAIEGTISTDSSGNFSTTVPLFCGAQIIKCVWSNEQGRYVLITEADRTDCTSADIQLTLNWDDLGNDFELHLIKPGGRINNADTDCTWNTCVRTQPDWGVVGDASDNPVKDVDDTGNFGPENIFLSSPETGTYQVLVEHWSGSGSPMADGTVTFNVAGETTVAEIQDLAPFSVWNVGTIDWPSGEVQLDGRRLDCTSDWSGGCPLDLPAQFPSDEAAVPN